MTLQCKPGRRLIVRTPQRIETCTMGGFVHFKGEYWGVTAGHAFEGFGDGQEVSYFPDSQLAKLGNYRTPLIRNGVTDLAKIAVDPGQISFAPVGYPLPPALYDEAQLGALVGKQVVFMGAQIGKTEGTVTAVGPAGPFSRAITANLDCAMTIPGDSGGPLYLEDGVNLFWIGNLSESRAGANASVCEALFLHPAAGLSALGIR